MLRIRMVSGTDIVALSDEELADAVEEDQTVRGSTGLKSASSDP